MALQVYIIRRILLLIPVILGITVLTFTISHLIPGDPAALTLGPHAHADQIAAYRHELGLDKPLYDQYWIYLKNLVHGNFGVSLTTHRPVAHDLREYFPATFELTVTALLITILLGLPLGVLSAVRKDTSVDHVSRIFSLTGVSMPIFWLGLLLQMVFAYRLGWLPMNGRVDTYVLAAHPLHTITGLYILDSLLTGNWPVLGSCLIHILLPAITLSYASLAVVTRMVRSSMLEVMEQDYIRTARAKGIHEQFVVYKHALKNALIPAITVIGLTFGMLLGGAFLTETIFSWPGMGRYAVGTITSLDFPAIMGVTLIAATAYVTANLIVDVLYAIVDTRIRYN
jgi:peptide/nickel transport system permease protein